LKQNRNLKDNLLLSLKGIAMGAADVVPGVSGGTIAFITGIYEELLGSIKSVNLSALQKLLKQGPLSFWNHINGNFLIVVLTGVLLSVLSFARGILFLLNHYPILIWSFFFGLILASAFIIADGIKKWNSGVIVSMLIGTAIAYAITVVSPAETPTENWFIFLSGAIAICAMILPGISGSFILLLLGKYEYILEALKDLKVSVILVFAAGCVSGLLGFSHLLSWMFAKYRDITIAVLAGFMVGSLNKVWPWKETLQTRLNSKGEEVPFLQENIFPGTYESLYNEPSQLIGALLLFVAGFLLVYLFEKVVNKKVDVGIKTEKA
jgi:putative membrane protein